MYSTLLNKSVIQNALNVIPYVPGMSHSFYRMIPAIIVFLCDMAFACMYVFIFRRTWGKKTNEVINELTPESSFKEFRKAIVMRWIGYLFHILVFLICMIFFIISFSYIIKVASANSTEHFFDFFTRTFKQFFNIS